MKGLFLAIAAEVATIPVELIDTADLPDGGTLRLLRRGDDYSIRFRDNELMGNQVRQSEEALAILACQRLPHHDSRVLIGQVAFLPQGQCHMRSSAPRLGADGAGSAL
ncbi:hypothetical protein [Sphingobium baderi]|uniref:hypothetical protein n=1 Tax=Sphingobium baderi TaxID=1332080 RepID=UPI002B40AA5D|nr:hypothetical protein [Sphingobium baderi]WRD77865.1 hypothetical protein QQ987_07130 [Sphingobium baderi]